MNSTPIPSRRHLPVRGVRHLTDTTYVLRFGREDLAFVPGQYLHVGARGELHMREYSIYSPPQAPFLEILVREIDGGMVSPRLRRLEVGEEVTVEGPMGSFTIDPSCRNQPHYLIATGTGISPFHCFVRSYPDLDYRLVQGVRYGSEAYELDSYPPDRLIRCISRENAGEYQGRVTDYLHEHGVDSRGQYYLCGNSDMIYEVWQILQQRGVPRDQVHTEVYF